MGRRLVGRCWSPGVFFEVILQGLRLVLLVPLAFVVLGVLGAAEARGLEGALRFQRLPPEGGLSGPEVYHAAQDASGFLWFVTAEGLDRYDGFSVKSYRFDPEDPLAVPESWIRFLYTDRHGDLWVGTSRSGLFRYAPDDDGFVRIRSGAGPRDPGPVSVLTLLDTGDGEFWVGTEEGLEIWDPESETFSDRGMIAEEPDPLDGLRVVSLHPRDGGGLWIGTGAGLFVLEAPRGRVRRVPLQEIDQRAVWRIEQEGGGEVWLASDNILYRLSATGELLDRFVHDPSNPGSLSRGLIHDLYLDTAGTLWIATENGLNTYDPVRKRFERHLNDLSDPFSVSHNTVFDLFEDRTGVIWVGTLDGVSFWDRGREKFVTFRRQEGRAESLAAFDVWSVIEDHQGRLWIAFGTAGLDCFDRVADTVAHFEHDPGNSDSLQEGPISVVFEDSDGQIWVGAHQGGLSRFDRASGRFRHFRHDPADPASLGHTDVQRLFEDRQGRLWVGTGGGLHVVERDTGEIVRLPTHESQPPELGAAVFFAMAEDPVGNLWFGTLGSGLFRREPGGPEEDSGVFHHFDSAEMPAYIMGLHWHSAGALWAGTAEGLVVVGADGRVERKIGQKDGLPGEQIRGILEDEDRSLWLATNHGLSRFDPVGGEIRNFDLHDGLQSNAFSTKAEFRSPGGEMFFGGWRGLTAFYPEKIGDDPLPPQVVFSDFRLLDQSLGPRSRDPESPLEVAIQVAEQVVLRPQDRVFGIELAALHFAAPSKNHFLYQLEGAGDEWIPLDARQRTLQFSNLAPGQYRLRVRASNKDGVWSEEPATLRLTVLPPWWRTRWAYGCYVLLLVSAVGLSSRQQRARLHHEREIAEQERLVAGRERAASQRLRQVDKLKDEFLANTSHELRTPLHGMTGLAESLLGGARGEVPAAMRADLEMIVSSGRRLSRLVNDILDFSKLRHHSLELDLRPVDLRAVVEVVLTLIRPLLKDKPVRIHNRVPADLPAVVADEDRLQQILHNLVGNAGKFTAEGKVTVSAELKEGKVEVRVTDTGPGIPAEAQERIFAAFEQTDASIERGFEGSGLGLAVTLQLVELHGGHIRLDSRPGTGTRVTFDLPLVELLPKTERSSEAKEGENSPAMAEPRRAPVEIEATPSRERQPGGSVHGADDSSRDLAEALRGKRILVVDDDLVNLRILENYLTHEGTSLTLAGGGEEALRLLGEQTFDLILLDIMMPKISGYEVCRQLRRSHPLEELPVIFLSALNQSSDVVTALQHGGSDYLTKPISRGELLARIRPHLDLVQVHRKLEDLVVEKVSEIKILQGLLPICAACKKIRDEEGIWNELESYMHSHSEAEFTHSVCPTCVAELYPEVAQRVNTNTSPT